MVCYAVSWRAVIDGHGVCTVSGVEFLHQAGGVVPNCLFADVELQCDLFICVAFSYVSDYLELSLC